MTRSLVSPAQRIGGGSVATSAAAGADGGPDAVRAGLLAVLAGVVEEPSVSLDANFFEDLGVDSLVMARFCARVRKNPALPSVAMKDVYRYPSIRMLAAAVALPVNGVDNARTLSGTQSRPALSGAPSDQSASASTSGSAMTVASDRELSADARRTYGKDSSEPVGRLMYLVCGGAQVLFFLAYSWALTALLSYGADWISGGGGPFDGLARAVFGAGAVGGYGWLASYPGALGVYLRSVVTGVLGFALVCTLPIAAKWVLVGRWRETEFPVWGWTYLRFWVVKTLIRINPLVLFAGSPLYVWYLRALGARIGRGTLILSPVVPVCTDLLRVGAGSVIRKDSSFTGYRAHRGMIQTGPVTMGERVFVGEQAVLDIHCVLDDDAQLGHASSLHQGQRVPAGQRWHGVPAQPTDTDFRALSDPAPEADGPAGWGVRGLTFSLGQLVSTAVLRLPLVLGGGYLLVTALPGLAAASQWESAAFSSWAAAGRVVAISVGVYLTALLGGLVVLALSSRVLGLAVRPDRSYRLYGLRYGVHRAISRITNRPALMRLFGDSSYVVGYLRYLGYRLDRTEQTGSNFGSDVRHDTPFLNTVGRGTMVADGLSLMNGDYSSSRFRLNPTEIGAHNFLGNHIAYPARGRTGDDCLLATKVMVPVDGPLREGVGLLGSPAFEIPRSVQRDHRFDVTDPDELRALLRAKNRHNLVTMALHLLVSWGRWCVLLLAALSAIAWYPRLGGAVGLVSVAMLAFSTGYSLLVDRALRPLQALRPDGCSIYDRAFWRHERYWKVVSSGYLKLFDGTPLKNVVWRLLGVRIGRQVFDDGAFMPERTFVTLGDRVTLNAGSVIQCHSQEDGAFKSDRTTIASGATIGVGALVHYGVRVGERAVIDADSFVMKGEQVDPDTEWSGNPARLVTEPGTVPRIDAAYVAALLRRIEDLQGQIHELTPRSTRRAVLPVAAALALLAVLVPANTRLGTALPAGWHAFVGGLAGTAEAAAQPDGASDPDGTPAPAGQSVGAVAPPGDDGDEPAAAPPPAPRRAVQPVPRVAARPARPVPPRAPVPRRTVPAPVRVVAPPPATDSAPTQDQAEANLKQAQAELKAAKQQQKKTKSSSKQDDQTQDDQR